MKQKENRGEGHTCEENYKLHMSAEDVYMLMLGAFVPKRLSEVSLFSFKAALMRRLQASFSECFCDASG